MLTKEMKKNRALKKIKFDTSFPKINKSLKSKNRYEKIINRPTEINKIKDKQKEFKKRKIIDTNKKEALRMNGLKKKRKKKQMKNW